MPWISPLSLSGPSRLVLPDRGARSCTTVLGGTSGAVPFSLSSPARTCGGADGGDVGWRGRCRRRHRSRRRNHQSQESSPESPSAPASWPSRRIRRPGCHRSARQGPSTAPAAAAPAGTSDCSSSESVSSSVSSSSSSSRPRRARTRSAAAPRRAATVGRGCRAPARRLEDQPRFRLVVADRLGVDGLVTESWAGPAGSSARFSAPVGSSESEASASRTRSASSLSTLECALRARPSKWASASRTRLRVVPSTVPASGP